MKPIKDVCLKAALSLVMAVAVFQGCSNSKSSGKTHEEFVKSFGFQSGQARFASKAAFLEKIGKPDNVVDPGQGGGITLYYKLKGGTAMIKIPMEDWSDDPGFHGPGWEFVVVDSMISYVGE